jgi:hypothetical protein
MLELFAWPGVFGFNSPMSAIEPSDAPKEPFRFRLIHVFYAMAILGASLATCGVGGIVLAAAIVVMWFAAFWRDGRPSAANKTRPAPRPFTLIELLVVIALISVVVALLLPAVRTARGAARRSVCAGHLKQIAVALHYYHDEYGSFPPAYLADERGKPMHSWRVLILPYLESGPLYRKYRFDEPWDGPNNRLLWKAIPEVYRCPNHAAHPGETSTSYFAVVGDRTAWPGAKSRTLGELTHRSSPILVVEGPPQQIAWSEPRDLSLKEAVELLHDPLEMGGNHNNDDGFFFTRIDGRNCVLADAALRWLPPILPRAIAERQCTIDGALTSDELDNVPPNYPRHVKWGNILRLAILICLTALPLPWALARMAESRRLHFAAGRAGEVRSKRDEQ